MESTQHLIVLQQAAEGSLPARIDSDRVVSLSATRDLIRNGYIVAKDVSSPEQAAFVNLSITSSGRQHLQHLRKIHPPATPRDWLAGRIPLWLRMLISAAIAIGLLYVSRLISGAELLSLGT